MNEKFSTRIFTVGSLVDRGDRETSIVHTHKIDLEYGGDIEAYKRFVAELLIGRPFGHVVFNDRPVVNALAGKEVFEDTFVRVVYGGDRISAVRSFVAGDFGIDSNFAAVSRSAGKEVGFYSLPYEDQKRFLQIPVETRWEELASEEEEQRAREQASRDEAIEFTGDWRKAAAIDVFASQAVSAHLDSFDASNRWFGEFIPPVMEDKITEEDVRVAAEAKLEDLRRRVVNGEVGL